MTTYNLAQAKLYESSNFLGPSELFYSSSLPNPVSPQSAHTLFPHNLHLCHLVPPFCVREIVVRSYGVRLSHQDERGSNCVADARSSRDAGGRRLLLDAPKVRGVPALMRSRFLARQFEKPCFSENFPSFCVVVSRSDDNPKSRGIEARKGDIFHLRKLWRRSLPLLRILLCLVSAEWALFYARETFVPSYKCGTRTRQRIVNS